MVADKKPYLEACEAAKTVLTDTSAIDTEMEELWREMEVVAGLTKKCIEENSTAAQDQEDYAVRYNGYVDRYEKAKEHKQLLEDGQALPPWKDVHIRCHDLRVTFCTMCYDAGIQIKALQA